MKASQILLGIIGIVILGWLLLPFSTVVAQPVAKDDPIQINFYYIKGCSYCESKEVFVNTFMSNHSEANVSFIQIDYELNYTEYFNAMKDLGIENPALPLLLFSKQTCHYGLQGDAITLENIEEWYQTFQLMEGNCFETAIPQTPIKPLMSFITGLVSGISPCLILISSLLFTGMSLEQRSRRPLLIGLGFILGVLLLNVCLGLVVLSFLDVLTSFFFDQTVRLIIAVPLSFLGIWYIVDAFNENSLLFTTPDRYKSVFKGWISRQSFLYAFILGFVFSFLKIPCIGGPMVALFLGLSTDFIANLFSLILYFLGLMIPLIIVMIIILRMSSSERFERIRVKYRPLLRILTGLIIIGLVLYSLLAF